jgi:hypothetical protein
MNAQVSPATALAMTNVTVGAEAMAIPVQPPDLSTARRVAVVMVGRSSSRGSPRCGAVAMSLSMRRSSGAVVDVDRLCHRELLVAARTSTASRSVAEQATARPGWVDRPTRLSTAAGLLADIGS